MLARLRGAVLAEVVELCGQRPCAGVEVVLVGEELLHPVERASERRLRKQTKRTLERGARGRGVAAGVRLSLDTVASTGWI